MKLKLGKAEKAVILLSLALLTGFAVYTAVRWAFAPELEISAAEFPVPGNVLAAAIEDELQIININTADAGKLASLPGVGEVLAARIIQYREENGSFANTEDIMNVYGIGEEKYMSMMDLITVAGDGGERTEGQ